MWVVDTLAGYFNVYLLLVSGVSVLLRLRWAWLLAAGVQYTALCVTTAQYLYFPSSIVPIILAECLVIVIVERCVLMFVFYPII